MKFDMHYSADFIESAVIFISEWLNKVYSTNFNVVSSEHVIEIFWLYSVCTKL